MSILRCPSITEPKLLRLNVTVIGYIFVAYDMDTYVSTLLHALHCTCFDGLVFLPAQSRTDDNSHAAFRCRAAAQNPETCA